MLQLHNSAVGSSSHNSLVNRCSSNSGSYELQGDCQEGAWFCEVRGEHQGRPWECAIVGASCCAAHEEARVVQERDFARPGIARCIAWWRSRYQDDARSAQGEDLRVWIHRSWQVVQAPHQGQ